MPQAPHRLITCKTIVQPWVRLGVALLPHLWVQWLVVPLARGFTNRCSVIGVWLLAPRNRTTYVGSPAVTGRGKKSHRTRQGKGGPPVSVIRGAHSGWLGLEGQLYWEPATGWRTFDQRELGHGVFCLRHHTHRSARFSGASRKSTVYLQYAVGPRVRIRSINKR